MFVNIPLIFLLIFSNVRASIVNITRENFDELIERTDDIWLVNFCDQDSQKCRDTESEFRKAGNIVERYAKLGIVNTDIEKVLEYRFKARSVPRVLLFGYDKLRPKDFTGFKTARGFSNAVLKMIDGDIHEQLKSRFVRDKLVCETDDYELGKVLATNQGDKNWCVIHYSSECSDCLKFAIVFKKLAEHFKHSFNFGAIDVLKHSHTSDKYPQIRHYINKDVVDSFKGDLTFDSLKRWLNRILPDPIVAQLTSKIIINLSCETTKYCVVITLPTLDHCDGYCRFKILHDIKQNCSSHKHLSLGWIWFETGEQAELEKLLKVPEVRNPIVTVVDVKKLIFLQMKHFKFEKLGVLLGHITDGTGFDGVIEVQAFPKIYKVVPWSSYMYKKVDLPKDNMKVEL